jgi:hypothetical protein
LPAAKSVIFALRDLVARVCPAPSAAFLRVVVVLVGPDRGFAEELLDLTTRPSVVAFAASLSFLRVVFLAPGAGAAALGTAAADVVVAEAVSGFSPPPKFNTMVEFSVCEAPSRSAVRGGERVDSSLDKGGDSDEELKFAAPPESPGNWRGDAAAADMLSALHESPPADATLAGRLQSKRE